MDQTDERNIYNVDFQTCSDIFNTAFVSCPIWIPKIFFFLQIITIIWLAQKNGSRSN